MSYEVISHEGFKLWKKFCIRLLKMKI
jgi:hypothetical protein